MTEFHSGLSKYLTWWVAVDARIGWHLQVILPEGLVCVQL